MDSERAGTYLRNLAESGLRRCRGGAPEAIFEDTARVRAVAAAYVIPPVAPSVAAVGLLLISRTAEVRASVPLTWWTS